MCVVTVPIFDDDMGLLYRSWRWDGCTVIEGTCLCRCWMKCGKKSYHLFSGIFCWSCDATFSWVIHGFIGICILICKVYSRLTVLMNAICNWYFVVRCYINSVSLSLNQSSLYIGTDRYLNIKVWAIKSIAHYCFSHFMNSLFNFSTAKYISV